MIVIIVFINSNGIDEIILVILDMILFEREIMKIFILFINIGIFVFINLINEKLNELENSLIFFIIVLVKGIINFLNMVGRK